MTFRPIIDVDEATRRLELIFPRAAFDTVLSSPSAGAAVAAMVYVDAVVPEGSDVQPTTWVRPTTCLWMSDVVLQYDSDVERRAWARAAARGKRAVAALQAEWGEGFEPRYGDNTRETLRDETFKGWRANGALHKQAGLATTSSQGSWALDSDFADLFDPALTEQALLDRVESWREKAMSLEARLKAMRATARMEAAYQVDVTLPDGTIRALAPGDASLILKGVLERWVPRRLADPIVLTISEPGTKIFTQDAKILSQLGVRIDQSRVLPDALVVDLGSSPAEYWVIEAVATDGPVDDERRERLRVWAADQGIDPDQCRFLSAFISRNDSAARRRLKDLASGTYAWYADEPDHELAWYEVGDDSAPVAMS